MASRSSAGVKSFTLKPLNRPQGMDLKQAEEKLMKISEAIHHINNQNSSHLSFEELYRCVGCPQS